MSPCQKNARLASITGQTSTSAMSTKLSETCHNLQINNELKVCSRGKASTYKTKLETDKLFIQHFHEWWCRSFSYKINGIGSALPGTLNVQTLRGNWLLIDNYLYLHSKQ